MEPFPGYRAAGNLVYEIADKPKTSGGKPEKPKSQKFETHQEACAFVSEKLATWKKDEAKAKAGDETSSDPPGDPKGVKPTAAVDGGEQATGIGVPKVESPVRAVPEEVVKKSSIADRKKAQGASKETNNG